MDALGKMFKRDVMLKAVVIGFCVGMIAAAGPEFQITQIQMDRGKQMLADIEQKSALPSGDCWKSALAMLGSGCKRMSQEDQSRLTFEFVSCYAQMMGMPGFMCDLSTPITECLNKVTSDPFLSPIYLQYFLHTQDMCYYLSQEIWQEHTNLAVNRLTDAASGVTLQLLEQQAIQEQIYTSQQQSLVEQSNMKKNNEDLYNAVTRVKDVFHEFSETAKEHQSVTVDIFEKLRQLHKSIAWIHGEMSSIDMIIFYCVAILLGYVGTSIPRTKGARFWLTIMFMVTIAAERKMHTFFTQPEYSYITPETIHSYVWIVRQGAAIIALLIVLVTYATYRDIQTVNNAILMNVQHNMNRMAAFFDANQVQIQPPVQRNRARDGNEGDDDSDDTFSNYSSDDSRDDLANELRALEEDPENDENVAPLSPLFTGGIINPVKSPVLGPYNLRARSSMPRDNPIVHQESPTAFAQAIKRQPRYYSSDEDEN